MEEKAFVVWVDELEAAGKATCCRICHDTESDGCRSLEAPCACKGTVKFAHRECIQRWCDEKGSTLCEICLQNYEPGYTFALKKDHLLQPMAVGDSLQIPVEENASAEGDFDDDELECTDAADISASFCRSLALTFAFLLLVRDLFVTCSEGIGEFPFPLFTVLVLRASGVVFPMYLVMKTIGHIAGTLRGHSRSTHGSRIRPRPPAVDNFNHRL